MTRFVWLLVSINVVLWVKVNCKHIKVKTEDSPPQTALGPMIKIDHFLVRKESIKGNLDSYAGFIDGKNDAKMFFWLIAAESQKSDPLILWLQGDLGTSSLRSLFENNGPFYVKLEKGTQTRKHYLSQKNNVLYLDTAVGTGYSHTLNKSEPLYPSDMDGLVDNIYTSLNSFYRIFEYLKNNDLYLGGDGFACQIITKLANRIKLAKHFKLKGLILENGFCDPLIVIPIASNLLNLRIIDPMKYSKIANVEYQIANSIKASRYEDAFDKYDSYIKGLLTPFKTHFNNLTFYESSQNLLQDNSERMFGNFTNFVLKQNIKHLLHVPRDLPYNNGIEILKKLRGELMKSSMTLLGELMNTYKVLMYFGQMNPEISPIGAYTTGSSIKWCGGKFFGLSYKPWFFNDKLVGYIAITKTGDCQSTFTWALVRNAGKAVASEKPEEITDLINKFISENQ